MYIIYFNKNFELIICLLMQLWQKGIRKRGKKYMGLRKAKVRSANASYPLATGLLAYVMIIYYTSQYFYFK